MVGEMPVEYATVARAEIELEDHRTVKLVFQSEDAIETAFSVVSADAGSIVDIVKRLPVVTDAAPQSGEAIETGGEMSFVHEVRSQFQRPEMRAIDIAVLGAQVELDGEMGAGEGFIGECLSRTDSCTEPVLVGGLCADWHHHSDEKGDKEEKYRYFFHYKILYHSYFQLFIKKNLK